MNRAVIAQWLARLGALTAGVAIPISTAAENIGAALLLLAGVLCFVSWPQLITVLRRPFVVVALVLSALLALATLWSPVSAREAWGFVLKMRMYWLVPFFILALQREHAKWLLIGFLGATGLSVLLSIGSAWMAYPIFKAAPGNWFIFRTHTYHNFFAGLLAVYFLVCILSANYKWGMLKLLYLGGLLLCVYDIFFLVQGRSGQLATLAMLALVPVIRWPKFGVPICVISLIFALIGLSYLSDNFAFRLQQAQNEVQMYEQGQIETSVGLRLSFYENSLKLINESPIFGHGTGAYQHEYKRLTGYTDSVRVQGHPHNDFLFLAIQAGLLAPLLLCLLLVSAMWEGRSLVFSWRCGLLALQVGMFIATLANSFFTDNITGVAYVLLTVALLSGPTLYEEKVVA